jgi:hypothetical protein
VQLFSPSLPTFSMGHTRPFHIQAGLSPPTWMVCLFTEPSA